MRKLTGYVVVAVVAAGCRATAGPPTAPAAEGLSIRESPTPYTAVAGGDVHALIPDPWEARLAGSGDGFEQGLIATPAASAPHRRLAEGLAAVWIDGTKVGVPSDYYYLAASGAAVDRLTHSDHCTPTQRDVLVDHRPAYAAGRADSPGDYVAVGQGICSPSDRPTRFAYFVAAPGYGPVHRVGIPSSGLYVVVAVVPDTPHAPRMLDKLLSSTRFGSTSVPELIRVARGVRSA